MDVNNYLLAQKGRLNQTQLRQLTGYKKIENNTNLDYNTLTEQCPEINVVKNWINSEIQRINKIEDF